MATASPSKRARSPEHNLATYNSAPPSKLTHSPSTRDSSVFTSGGAAAGTINTTSKSMASMLSQQASDYDGSSGYAGGGAPPLKLHQQQQHQQHQQQQPRSVANHSSSGGRIYSDSPTSMHAPQPSIPSSSSNYRIASHSGSTTSGGAFSAVSAGSPYDGGQYATYNNNDIVEPGSAIPSSAGSGHGLAVHVQGPGYSAHPSSSTSPYPSSSSRPPSHNPSPAHHHAPQPHPPASNQLYYSQPYGYPASAAAASQPPSTSMHYSSSAGPSSAYHPSSASHMQQHQHQQQAYPGSIPAAVSHYPQPGGGGPPYSALSQQHRRSIAGQSAGGSSYHSGASASPTTGHRRSDDLMDGSFVSGATSGQSSIHSSTHYPTPMTEAPSPTSHKPPPPPQAWSAATQPGLSSSITGSSHHMGVYGGGDPSKSAQAPGGSPTYASTQNYQAIVDEIMNQTRRGTDYGLDLGDFEMLDTLGTGTFGRVLLVRLHPRASSIAGLNAGMPHYFAMKVLAKTEVVRLKQVEHISCERSILGAVDHPGIVNLFCTFQDHLNIYMLLEFVQGGELFSHLRRAVRFSADVTRFYAANIILVLEYLHNRNLIYRDLKPENLLLDAHGYLKVTDFGFAKYVPDRTFTLCGTPEYLAPEIINSAGHGKAADWWAFGVLLFEMLCGYPPFFDESPWGIYEKILAGNFSFPPHVDPVARDLIRRLLSSDRSKRLGNLRGGAMDVKTHQWFEGVDWNAVEKRLIPAPIVPRIKSTSDSQNFERYPAIPLETLPGLAKAKGIAVIEEPDPYEHMFANF